MNDDSQDLLITQVDDIINALISEDFESKDVIKFTSIVKSFLSLGFFKTYALTVLCDKIQDISALWSKVEPLYFYRKIIKIILDIDNQELNDTIETFFVKENRQYLFFVMLEEKVSRKLDTDSSQKIFITLNKNFELPTFKQFLNIIEKNDSYAVSLLLKYKQYDGLKNYINLLGKHHNYLGNVAQSIANHYFGESERLITFIATLLCFSADHIGLLVNKLGNHADLEKTIINLGLSNVIVVINYCAYLSQHNPHRFSVFEDEFISKVNGKYIYIFATKVPNSNKRKLLRQLVKIKDETNLVEFIKYFPEYKSLLPML